MPTFGISKALSFVPNFPGKLRLGHHLLGASDRLEEIHRLRHFRATLNLDDRIQRRMFLKRCHEPETEGLFRRLARTRHCFVDVGANIGYFSLLAAAANPRIECHAFEPLPANVARMRKNLELNPGFGERIYVDEVCLWSECGEAEFGIPPAGECGWGRLVAADSGGARIPRVTRTLDSLADRWPRPVDFLKIDVEGGELEVLRGARRTLARPGPFAACLEINEPCLAACGTSGEEIFSWMRGLGFTAYAYSRWRGWEPVAGPRPAYRYLNYFFLREIGPG